MDLSDSWSMTLEILSSSSFRRTSGDYFDKYVHITGPPSPVSQDEEVSSASPSTVDGSRETLQDTTGGDVERKRKRPSTTAKEFDENTRVAFEKEKQFEAKEELLRKGMGIHNITEKDSLVEGIQNENDNFVEKDSLVEEIQKENVELVKKDNVMQEIQKETDNLLQEIHTEKEKQNMLHEIQEEKDNLLHEIHMANETLQKRQKENDTLQKTNDQLQLDIAKKHKLQHEIQKKHKLHEEMQKENDKLQTIKDKLQLDIQKEKDSLQQEMRMENEALQRKKDKVQQRIQKERATLQEEKDTFQQEKTKLQEEIRRMSEVNKIQESRIKLDVGGHVYTTSMLTLTKDQESMLALMSSGRHYVKKEEDGSYFIDRDGTHFRHILNYLRDGFCNEDTLPTDRGILTELLTEAEYYQLSGLVTLLVHD